MRERAENELLSLQKVAEREIRKALLTSEALVVLPRVANIVHSRRIMNPPLPQSSSFFISGIYTKDYHNNDRLLLYDNDDPKFQINQLENVQSTGRILV
ncbi:unnamed protein product [Rotaria sp. Silwood2]|nr:unnamed protein product [Rotaria sp. Silwood2]CAF4381729.1 unnamed protein product [Rotaria sp. Silwood2]